MSQEQLYGQAGEEAAQGYTPMADVSPREPEPDSPVTDFFERHEAEAEKRKNPTERTYVQIGGENAGKPMPDNQTLSIERATRDLTNIREYEAQQAQAEVDQRLAAEVDQLRHPFAAQASEQQPEQQVKQQPEAPPVEVQPETPQEVAGADPDLVRVISENPKLANALQTEAAINEATRQAYAQGLQQNSAAAFAALFSEYPEVAQLSPGEFPAALKVLAQNNPERARALVEKLQTVNSIVSHWQQESAQQRQRLEAQYKAEFAEWSRNEDDKFAALVPEVKDPRSDLGHAAVSTLRQAGFSDEDVVRAWSGDASLSLRDHRAQIILMKAALYDRAQATAPQKVHRPVPPVQRPGVSRDRSDYADDQVAGLRQRLARTGDVRDAAKLVLAQRAARGG